MSHACTSPPGGSGQPAWPRLRRSLRFEPLPETGQPFPAVVISDPISGRYCRAGWPVSGMLMLWNEVSGHEELAAAMQAHFGTAISEEELKQTVAFIFKSELSDADAQGGWRQYAQLAGASRHGLMTTLMHNYLFFRVPLVRPDAFLRRQLPSLTFVFRRWFWLLVACMAAVGLYLSTRQWGAVMDAVARSLQFQQIFIYAMALFLLKGIHEMGHALTTVHYGCRVHSMGVACMLGAPMLYTDTSDSWRLSNHRQRLAIVFAGVAAESIVAALAILAWPLLSDGTIRQISFSFASTAIATSLIVNLNPLMRFDGYFALSDYWQVPNLQTRSFSLASWKLREVLFGLADPPPENFPPRKQNMLILYAYCVWIYRFFLYLGIAYLVYVMAGKAIGIILGLFELVFFIIRPIWQELSAWWTARGKMRGAPRARITAAVAFGITVLLVTPCLSTIESPGVLIAGEEQEIHVPSAAKLTAIAVVPGQTVRAGDVLFEAESAELDHELRKAGLRLRLAGLRLSRLLANSQDREQAVVLQQEHKAAREKYDGIERSRRALKIVAPFSGHVTDMDPALAPGIWVNEADLLARITSTTGARVKAMVSDTNVNRIRNGAHGVFVADEADLPSQIVTLEGIAPASNGKLPEAALGDVNGGPIPSSPKDHELKSRDGWVEVTFVAPDAAAPVRLIRGVVKVESQPHSPLFEIWQRVGAVFVREQNF